MSGKKAEIAPPPSPLGMDSCDDSPFAVGDKVLIAEKDDMFSSGMPDIGTVDTIASISTSGNYVLRSGFTYYASSLRHADPEAKYEPVVGDVVSFEYDGIKRKGVVYRRKAWKNLYMASIRYGAEISGNAISDASNVRKIGQTDIFPAEVDSCVDYRDKLKAYFSDTCLEPVTSK